MNWIQDKLIRAGLPALAKYGVAFALAHNANAILSKIGVTVDWSKFQVEITALLGMAFEIVEEHIKDWQLKATSPGGKQ